MRAAVIVLVALGGIARADAPDGIDSTLLARTVDEKGFWSGTPIGASQCASCHPDVAAQWSSSAHRFASFDNPYYAAAIDAFRKERGNEASRFCARCHDQALLPVIDKPIDRHTREAQAGIVCLTCHSIADHPPRTGNGAFIAKLDPWSTKDHARRLRPSTLSTAELCGSCHRVGLSADVTHGRWLRGQDDYGAWLASSVSGNGASAIHRAPSTKTCQACHMPLEPATADAAAKDGRVRSHRFLGANLALTHLRGDDDHAARTRGLLASAVTMNVELAGDAVDVVLTNHAGHRFPGGTMDSNEVWLEVRALDARGRTIGSSGVLSSPRAMLPGSTHRVRAQMVDGRGQPLRFRDVQNAAGVVYDTSLPPGDPQAVRYALPTGTSRVEARLLYRKLSPEYTRFACGTLGEACTDVPIAELAKSALVVAATPCASLPWDRVLDHGIALAAALSDRAEEARSYLTCAADREPTRIEPVLGLARLSLALGRTDDVLAYAARAAKLDPSHPASAYLTTVALLRAYRPARASAEALLRRLPSDPTALALVARARNLDHDPRAALAATTALLAIDPDSEDGHWQRALAEKALHRDASVEESTYLARRVATEENLALRSLFDADKSVDESEPLHVHSLSAASFAAR